MDSLGYLEADIENAAREGLDKARSDAARALGKLGGAKLREKYGVEHFAEIGAKGGKANVAKHDSEHFRKIGSRGGRKKRVLKVQISLENEEAEYTVDKSEMHLGPWQTEPDKLQWKTKSGLPGLIVRNEMGALCGYAAISESHPAFEKDYNDVDVSVHGGLTYAAHCRGPVCHVPEPGEPDHVWWFGFDCAHFMDVVPGMEAFDLRSLGAAQYRDLAYVQEQVEQLAEQLVALGNSK